jgi:Cytidylyltransferase family.
MWAVIFGLANLAALVAGAAISVVLLATDHKSSTLPVLISLPVSGILYLITLSFLPYLVTVLSLASAKYLYSRRFFLVSPWLLAIGIIMYSMNASQMLWRSFDIAIGYGTAVALFTDATALKMIMKNEESRGSNRHIEVIRDLLHMGAGAILVALALGYGEGHLRIALTIAVFPFYYAGNYFSLYPGSRLGRAVHSLERPSTALGIGAIWFAAGTLIALGLVNSTPALGVVLFATTIGDPLATLFGTRFNSPRLPFNRKKSMAGFSAILISSSSFSYLLLGIAGIFLGVVAALAESFSYYPLDDNFAIPVILGTAVSLI